MIPEASVVELLGRKLLRGSILERSLPEVEQLIFGQRVK